MSKADVLRIPDYLEHILEAIERIDRYLPDTDEIAFLNDQKTQGTDIGVHGRKLFCNMEI